jgi:general secretion pathway protein G
MKSVHVSRKFVRRGFTLIELMLVLVILAVLAAVVLPSLSGKAERSREAAAKAELHNIGTALDGYETDVGHYPSSDEGIRALIEPLNAKNWHGPYLKHNDVPKDPWGKEYIYRYPPSHNKNWPDVSSAGPDGQEGTADDIDNWTQS